MEKQRGGIRMGWLSKGSNRKKTLMALTRNCCLKNTAKLEKMKLSSDPQTLKRVLEVVRVVKGSFPMTFYYLQIYKF